MSITAKCLVAEDRVPAVRRRTKRRPRSELPKGELPKSEILRRVIFGELRRLFRDRYGPTFPDDSAGREDLRELLLLISLGPNAETKMIVDEVRCLIAGHPRRPDLCGIKQLNPAAIQGFVRVLLAVRYSALGLAPLAWRDRRFLFLSRRFQSSAIPALGMSWGWMCHNLSRSRSR